MYSTLVIAYLFLGGAAGGAYFVMACWSLAFFARDDRQGHRHRARLAFGELQKASYTIALALLIGAELCLFADLTLPNRALLLVLRPRPTAITFGAFALGLQTILGMGLFVAHGFNPRLINGRVRRILEAVTVPCALGIMVYTGVYLALPATVAFWHTWTLVALFLFSSLSSGVSVVLLTNYFTRGKTLVLRTVQPLQNAHVVCLIAEAVALAAFLATGFNNPLAAGSIRILMEQRVLWTGIVGVLGMGLVAPMTLESYALRRGRGRTIPISDVICLIGSLCLRWCIIMCGVH